MEWIPIWAFFVGTILLVLVSMEFGYRAGRRAHRRSEEEKEAPISNIAGAILGLVAFMLAFTFGIVSDRYYARLGLVRDEANVLRTAHHRADFLPSPDREEAKRLLEEYVGVRLDLTQGGTLEADRLRVFLSETARIQDRLWERAVVHGRADLNSEIGSLYLQSLNEIVETHALRVALGVQARIPTPIWFVLVSLTVMGMMAMGYHTGISGSKRSWTTLILALAFALVIAVIAALDRPTGFVRVTQQPLIDLRRDLQSGE